MASNGCSRISHFSDRASGMPVSWNPTVTLLQKKREETQNSNVGEKLNGTASAFTDESMADGSMADGSMADGSTTSVGIINQEQLDNLSAKVLENRNETEETTNHKSDEVIENTEKIPPTAERDIPKSSDDSQSVSKDLENVKIHETDDKKALDKSQAGSNPWSPPHASYRLKRYQNQPMKIENYEPGMSSVVLQDSFINNYYNPPIEKPGEHCRYTVNDPDVKYQIRKANGAVSPSLLEASVHELYRKVQKGGEIPLEGLRCPIPPVKAHRLCLPQRIVKDNVHASTDPGSQSAFASQVNSGNESSKTDRPHSASAASTCAYVLDRRTKDELSAARRRELEFALIEARKKRLIEEAENNRARRHSDYFHPHVKSPVALNRYDLDDLQFRSGSLPTSPSPIERPLVKARALYTFRAQTNRELSLNKGDTVYILRPIDKNWYEGQRHGTVGIFPVNYVEVLESYLEQNYKDRANLLVAKFDFVAEYPAELSFQKGDVVKLIQVVDCNWYEGAIGSRIGLVPKAYVEPFLDHLTVPLTIPVTTSFTELSQHDSPGTMSSTSSCLSSGVEPPLLTLSHDFHSSDWNASPSVVSNPYPSNAEADLRTSDKCIMHTSELVTPYRGRSNSLGAVDSVSADPRLDPCGGMMPSDFPCRHPGASEDDHGLQGMKSMDDQNAVAPDAYYYTPESRYGAKWHIENNDILPHIVCQALYSYVPQDEDELELSPGDIVLVTEIFDDGWYVGISQRKNTYGTFPGNYVQRLRLCHPDPYTV